MTYPNERRPVDASTLLDDHGESLVGLCGHCQVDVDNHDANHRVSAIVRGGRGVECVLRGDIHPQDAAPMGKRQRIHAHRDLGAGDA